MTISHINGNLSVNTNNTVTFNKDITQAIEKNGVPQHIIVCKLSCYITRDLSISYSMKVVDLEAFNKNKDIIQEEIDAFKVQAQLLAKEYNVPII